MISSSQAYYKSLLTLSALFPCLAHSQPLAQISVASGILQQDYREFSASAPNGTLNQETGNLNTWQIQANYLPTLPIGKLNLPLYVQGQYRQSDGNTQYNGYLQQGQMLTSFVSKTNNSVQDSQLSVGLRFNHQAFQLTPLASYSYHTWQRDLLQYQEVFHHQALLLGVLATWHMNTKWQMNSQLRVGRISTARINVPQLYFDASLASKSLKTAQVSIAYRINKHWQAAVTADYQRYSYGESTISNGFFEPASKTQQRSVLAGMYYYY